MAARMPRLDIRAIVGVATLILSATSGSAVATAAEARAVIELFTSQGCSSCPPADRILGELSRDPSLVPLSLSVDYWDYIGWKDTLALHDHTVRQHAYSRVRGDRAIYTPQVVVNGVGHVVGSDKAAVERAIARTRASSTPLSVPVTVTLDGDKLTITVAASETTQRSEIWLCPVISKVDVPIARGENNGRSLTYYNVVRGWKKIGDYSGKADTFSIPLAAVTDSAIDRVAVVVQEGGVERPGAMLGAALTAIR
jgi:hypothetical protein